MREAGQAGNDVVFPSRGLPRGQPDIRHGMVFEEDMDHPGGEGLSPSEIADFLDGVASGAEAGGAPVGHARLVALAAMVRSGSLVYRETVPTPPGWLSDPWMGTAKMSGPEAMGIACQLASMTVEALADVPDSADDPHPLSSAASRVEGLDILRSGVADPIKDFSTLAGAVTIHTGSAVRLETGWAYVRACLGDHASMYRISGLLQRSATGLPHDAAEGSLRERILATADGWRRLSAAHAPVESRSRVDALTRASAIIAKASFDLRQADAWAAAARLTLPPAPLGTTGRGGPSMPVLDGVGDPESQYGKDAARRFRPLMSPMPLRGGGLKADDVYAAMRREFPWMEEANRKLAEAAALCAAFGVGHFRSQPLLVVGAPGVGKTRWARRAAEVLGLGHGYLAFSGGTSAMSVTGVERGWAGGRPSFAANAILSSRTANPLLFVDELDKAVEGNSGGSALDALLPFIEAETASRAYDNFLLGNLDLSEVFWVAAANALDKLPGRLLGRFDVVHAGRPQARDFPVVMGGILDDWAAANRVPRDRLPGVEGSLARFESLFVEGGCSPRTLKLAVQSEMASSIWSPPGPRAVT